MSCWIQEEMKIKSVVSTVLISFVLGLVPTISAANPVTASGSTPVDLFIPCVDSTSTECIEGMKATLPSGEVSQAVLTGRQSVAKGDGYKRRALFEWSFPGLIFQNGTSRAFLYASYTSPEDLLCDIRNWCYQKQERMTVMFTPSDIDGSRPDVIITDSAAKNTICPTNSDVSLLNICKIDSPNWLIASKVVFEVTLRTSRYFISNYAEGRVEDLNVNQDTALNPGLYRKVSVSFSPVEHQIVDLNAGKSFEYFYLWSRLDAGVYNPLQAKNKDYSPIILENSLYLSDTPLIIIHGLSGNTAQRAWECGAGKVSISTNAYYWTIPDWDKSTDSLRIRLTSPHLDSQGKLSTGTFQFKVSEELAWCLFRVNVNKQLFASVSVTYSDKEEPEVTTLETTLRNGFFTINFNNFHYSSPNIRMKLVEAGVEVAAEPKAKIIEGSKDQVAARKKLTITCLKGKLTKKVTGLAPKCPTGYKKK
jgi:hypothetical protein